MLRGPSREEGDPAGSRGVLCAGLVAGICLGIADWSAAGLVRTPLTLVAATLVGGALLGAIAGGAAALLGRPGLAAGSVVAAGVVIEGASVASKELAHLRLAAILAVGLLGAVTLGLSLGRPRAASPLAWGWLFPASLPAASVQAAALLPDWPWARIATAAAPLLVLVLERRFSRARIGAALLALASIPILVLPAWSLHPVPERRLPSLENAPNAENRPSVVLLVVDTLRAGALDPGGPIARFATEGIEFRQAVSAAPWTLPALGSLFTSLHPSQHGAIEANAPLSEEVTTLAEVLRAHGYSTQAFTGGAFVGPAHRLDQGFEHFDWTCERRFESFRLHAPLVWRLAKNRYFPLLWLVRWVDEYRGLRGGLEAAVAHLHQTTRARPAFVFLHTYQVHDYYLYDADDDDAVLAEAAPVSARFAGRLSVPPSELAGASQADLDHFRALYAGRVRAVERLFPELLRSLQGFLGEDVLWIVTADHGEGFDAAGGRVHHGGRLHDDLLRVPLLLRVPGWEAPGTVVDAPVRTIDVMPTVLDLLGLPIPEGVAGESLLPALRGKKPFPAAAFGEELAHGLGLRSVRTDGWKLITAPNAQELYDLARDPGESSPLTSPAPEELARELDSFAERFPPREAAEIELDGATLEHLRALGYVR